jgi:hypothetical protein
MRVWKKKLVHMMRVWRKKKKKKKKKKLVYKERQFID